MAVKTLEFYNTIDSFLGSLSIVSTIDAISTSTGALKVLGGVGIGGRLYVDNLYIENSLTYLSPNPITLGDIILTGTASMTDTTDSTSETTGSLILAGGMGIKKNVNI